MTPTEDSAQRIVPHLWFDEQAEEAAAFYTSLFEASRVGPVTRYRGEELSALGRPEGSVMNVDFELAGQRFAALNGGPEFSFTPAISFFVVCPTEAELEALWGALSEGGEALMPLDEYDWAERFGWVRDRWGLTWQVCLGDPENVGQKITPSLLFTGDQHGRAEEAVRFYTSVFDDSEIEGILRHGPDEAEPGGTVKHAQFRLDGQVFMATDGAMDHGSGFNEAISLLVRCGSQEEVDRYWDALTPGGDPEARRCGWLKDRFGVSWQVCPTVLQEMMRDPDPEKVDRVTRAFMPMEKLEIATLKEAYAG